MSEVSGSPLADRLTRAGASAILVAYGPATERKARLAISAALRELVEAHTLRDSEGKAYAREAIRPADLEALAVSVEKGENT